MGLFEQTRAALPAFCLWIDAERHPPARTELSSRVVYFMTKRITQIPFPGSSGQTPTGALQFQDDWPGLFLRGDAAIPLCWSIRSLELRLGDHKDPIVMSALVRLKEIADLIERDVIMRDQTSSQ